MRPEGFAQAEACGYTSGFFVLVRRLKPAATCETAQAKACGYLFEKDIQGRETLPLHVYN
jgi:hypothetical protein